MKVREVMTRDVATCPATASAADAARIMWDHDCGIVPVTDGENRLRGVITDRDACMASLMTDQPLSRIPVSQCMAAQVFSCREDQDLTAVQTLMRAHQIRRVPVVDAESRVIGIVSLNDLAVKSGNAKSAAAKGLNKEVSETLRAICARSTGTPGSSNAVAAQA